jgi:hypothetical protein
MGRSWGIVAVVDLGSQQSNLPPPGVSWSSLVVAVATAAGRRSNALSNSYSGSIDAWDLAIAKRSLATEKLEIICAAGSKLPVCHTGVLTNRRFPIADKRRRLYLHLANVLDVSRTVL